MAMWLGNCLTWISLFFLVWEGASSAGNAYGYSPDEQGLISCLMQRGISNWTRISSNPRVYDSLLIFSVQNLRFAGKNVPKPYALILPRSRKQVQDAVACSIQHGWEIRVRSGGHSYEGLSYTSYEKHPKFVVIDLMNLGSIKVNLKSKTAWVEAGATVGQVLSAIADKTQDYGFPTGVCPSMGVGGHFSGGGMGLLIRKYGTSADNVVDALVIDAKSNLLNRKKMGEDVFWALRGGGGGSWGVVVAWKIQLVNVPRKITSFNIQRTGVHQILNLLHRWQTAATSVSVKDDDFYVRAIVSGGVNLTFSGMYLGPQPQLLHRVKTIFPEMGLDAKDCNETDFIAAYTFAAVKNGYSPDLRQRFLAGKTRSKMKSDFLTKPISRSGLAGALKTMREKPASLMIMAPLGGVMSRIPSDRIAFPHRNGYLYDIQYVLYWNNNRKDAESLAWMRRLYDYMTPFVSNSPRAAYVNYLDLELGSAITHSTSWGESYFGRPNFKRLVQIKTKFDPHNIFRNEQSIPVHSALAKGTIQQ